MIAFVTQNFVPLLFAGLLFFLLTGIPVAFGLAATGLLFGFLGMQIGLFGSNLFQALPQRVFGIMSNDTLLAIPFFTFMGIILERSGMAEDLLETVGQVFGPLRGGLAVAVILVGALLAATTGVVAAAVISMGLISLPIMLRYGYHRTIATGTITASGTLAQAIPPSLVLIVLADQLGRSVGDMYAGAMIPALLLVALYLAFIAIVAVLRPSWVPALPPEARIYREPDGASGHASLLALLVLSAAAGWTWSRLHDGVVARMLERTTAAPGDEVLITSLTVASLVALALALVDRVLCLGLLSRLARQVTFVLIPPLVLIFLVLGTIFLGIATPTEGGAMGALGALVMATARRRLGTRLLRQALDSTARLSTFVMFILIGSTVFSFTFNAADGHVWVEHLFSNMPGGAMGFLIVVNLLVFVLGAFIDFFEIAFIVVPMLAPVAEKLLPQLLPGVPPDAVMIWFGVILAMNLQTSFLTPPFGFALFYLRSVAPRDDYRDRVTGRTIPGVTTAEIYRGSIAYIVLQSIMVVAVIAMPGLVTGGIVPTAKVDADKALEQMSLPAPADDPLLAPEAADPASASIPAPEPLPAPDAPSPTAPGSDASGGQQPQAHPNDAPTSRPPAGADGAAQAADAADAAALRDLAGPASAAAPGR